MTEEEFKNLKVGDVFVETYSDASYIQFKVESVGSKRFRVISIDDCEIDHVHIFNGQIESSRCELLPLYNSPLYLAMSESDDSNVENEKD